ncbi:MAG: glycosyltransferase, partial [Bacteroidetes bacterium]
AWIVLAFLGLRLAVSLLNWLWPLRLAPAGAGAAGRISILIPARNEAANLPALLRALAALPDPALEILILDDQSEDETPALLAAAAAEDPRLRILTGQLLPEGWLGKNSACHQLAAAASGDWLLFLDADIEAMAADLPQRLRATAVARGLALLSVFPDQDMQSWGERLTVPLMHYLLLSLLPLRAVPAIPLRFLAAANGQCMFFEAATYRQWQWHAQVRRSIVEDIAIMVRVKAAGYRGMVVAGTGALRCRMYRSYRDGLAGFSKNLLAGFGGALLLMWAFLAVVLLGWIPLRSYLAPPLWGLWLGAIALMRGAHSRAAGQSFWNNLLLHPFHMLTLGLLGLLSTYKYLRGKNQWKGRNVQLPRRSFFSSFFTR